MGHGAWAAARMVTLGEARGVWRFIFLLFPPVDMPQASWLRILHLNLLKRTRSPCLPFSLRRAVGCQSLQRISTPQEKDVSEQKDVQVRGRLLGRLYSGVGFLRDFLGRSWFRLVFRSPKSSLHSSPSVRCCGVLKTIPLLPVI